MILLRISRRINVEFFQWSAAPPRHAGCLWKPLLMLAGRRSCGWSADVRGPESVQGGKKKKILSDSSALQRRLSLSIRSRCSSCWISDVTLWLFFVFFLCDLLQSQQRPLHAQRVLLCPSSWGRGHVESLLSDYTVTHVTCAVRSHVKEWISWNRMNGFHRKALGVSLGLLPH